MATIICRVIDLLLYFLIQQLRQIQAAPSLEDNLENKVKYILSSKSFKYILSVFKKKKYFKYIYINHQSFIYFTLVSLDYMYLILLVSKLPRCLLNS